MMLVALGTAIGLRRAHVRSFWPYVIGPGALSWAALHFGGFHPALALVPIVPLMPHSARDLGLFDPREDQRTDTLNRFEHWWAMPVQLVLLLFGFANAGVPFEQIGPGTYYVLAGLLFGKPIGILLFSTAARLAGGSLPPGLGIALLFSAIAFAGSGGGQNLCQSNWIRDKGMGMGSVVGYIPSAVGGKTVRVSPTGSAFALSASSPFATSPGWRRGRSRATGWSCPPAPTRRSHRSPSAWTPWATGGCRWSPRSPNSACAAGSWTSTVSGWRRPPGSRPCRRDDAESSAASPAASSVRRWRTAPALPPRAASLQPALLQPPGARNARRRRQTPPRTTEGESHSFQAGVCRVGRVVQVGRVRQADRVDRVGRAGRVGSGVES